MTDKNNHTANGLPKDWKWVKLGDIANINPKLQNKESIKGDLEVQFIPMKLVEEKNNKIHLTETRQFNEVQKGSYTAFMNGDIIFAKVTPCMENGKIAVVNNLKNGIGYGSSEFHVLRCNTDALNKYLFYFVVQDKYRSEAQNAMTGAVGLRRVPKQFIENYQIPLPPKFTQQTIVSKLEELFSELDKGIEQLKTAQQQLKVYRQAVVKWAFEGRLTNENVKSAELPPGWKWINLGEHIEKVEAGKSFKCDEREPKSHEIGVLKVSAVSWGEFDETESKTVTDKSRVVKDYFVRKGDFLFSRANTLELVGASVIVKHVSKRLMLSDKTLRIIYRDSVNPFYALYYLRCRKGRNEIEKLSTGNQESMRNIGQERIKQIEMPYCSLEEQNKVVQEIETRLSVADKLEETITSSLQQAGALRQSILKSAFEGKLTLEKESKQQQSLYL